MDFAQRIPIKHKLGNFENTKRIDENTFGNKKQAYREFDDGKNVLRKAMTGFMPQSVLDRKKQGFSAPDESWFRGENAAYVKEILLSKETVSTEFINAKFIERTIDEHINKRINHRLLIWSLLNFEWWCRIFLHGVKL